MVCALKVAKYSFIIDAQSTNNEASELCIYSRKTPVSYRRPVRSGRFFVSDEDVVSMYVPRLDASS